MTLAALLRRRADADPAASTDGATSIPLTPTRPPNRFKIR